MKKYLAIQTISNLFVAAFYSGITILFTKDTNLTVVVFLVIFQLNVAIDYAVYIIQNKLSKMSTLPAMPDKWAVKIESEAEAVELQALFPNAKSFLNDSPVRMFNDNPTYRPAVIHSDPNFPQYIRIEVEWIVKENGYTIYTLNQLKELLKSLPH
jgi:hypothetical protein